MSTILLLEAVNLFLGDADPTKSKHISLSSLTLPTLEYQKAEHNPGGAPGAIEFNMGATQKLECSFKLAGFDPEAYKMFGVNRGQVDTFTAYGIIRDKREGVASQAKAIIRGAIGKVAPESFERGKMFGHDHSITEISHYELHIAGQEWYWWDMWTSVRPRSFGSSDAEYLAMLGLA